MTISAWCRGRSRPGVLLFTSRFRYSSDPAPAGHREDERPEPQGPRCDLPRHHAGATHGVPVEDQKHGPSVLAQQPPKEAEEHGNGKGLLEERECEVARIRDGGEHIAPKLLGQPGDELGLPSLAIRGARLVIGVEPHFVAQWMVALARRSGFFSVSPHRCRYHSPKEETAQTRFYFTPRFVGEFGPVLFCREVLIC